MFSCEYSSISNLISDQDSESDSDSDQEKEEEISLEEAMDDADELNLSITYHILIDSFREALDVTKTKQINIVKASVFKKYISEFNDAFSLTFMNRSSLVKELYTIYYTSRAFDRYFKDHLQDTISYTYYRAKLYYPNIMYILVRLLPNLKKFLQGTIRKVYQEISSRSRGLINVHINSFALDQDVIKTDILYSFLGNGIKKFNPLDINNIVLFYKTCIRQVFFFYLKSRKNLSKDDVVSLGFLKNIQPDNASINSNRISIYKDVLYNIHIEKTYSKIPVLSQIGYNYQIFKNIIISNEFQSIYQTTKSEDSVTNNNEFKLIDFFEDDIFTKNPEVFVKIRKLPLIYRLLKCVHIHSAFSPSVNCAIIKHESVKDVIIQEMTFSFKNLYDDRYIKEIMEKIADNFVKNILTGEYINLITFNTVRINHISFLDQLRKFVRICLDN